MKTKRSQQNSQKPFTVNNMTVGVVMQGLSTLLSRISGLTRDIITAKILGAGLLSDVFFMSFRIPNSIRKLIGEGPLSATFVPIFIKKMHKNRLEARKFSGAITLFMLLASSVCCITLMVFTNEFIKLIAPGFYKKKDALNTLVALSRISLPFMIFTPIVGVLGGITNGMQRFFAFGITPLILNLTMISCLLLLGDLFPNKAFGLALGVSLGGAFQIIFMLYACKKNNAFPIFRLTKKDLFSQSVKTFFLKLAPITLSQGVFQINMFVDGVFASFTPKMASYLYYSDRLNQFVITIIGHTLGSVSLPMIAAYLHQNKKSHALNVQNNCTRWSIIWSVPAAMSLFALADVVVALIYQRGQFLPEDTRYVANMIKITSLVIPIMSLNKILYSSIYSIEKPIVPILIGACALVVNLASNLIIMNRVHFYYIIISTSFSSFVEFCLLLFVLRFKSKFLSFTKDLAKTFIMAISFGAVTAFIAKNMHGALLAQINSMTSFGMVVILCVCIYTVLAAKFGLIEYKNITGIFKKNTKNNDRSIRVR